MEYLPGTLLLQFEAQIHHYESEKKLFTNITKSFLVPLNNYYTSIIKYCR